MTLWSQNFLPQTLCWWVNWNRFHGLPPKKSWHHKFAGPKADFNRHGRSCREKFTNDWLMYQTDSVCNDFHIKEITCQTCQNVSSLSQGIQGKLAPCWHLKQQHRLCNGKNQLKTHLTSVAICGLELIRQKYNEYNIFVSAKSINLFKNKIMFYNTEQKFRATPHFFIFLLQGPRLSCNCLKWS